MPREPNPSVVRTGRQARRIAGRGCGPPHTTTLGITGPPSDAQAQRPTVRGKHKGLRFALSEDCENVTAALMVDGLRVVEFENEQAPRVNVRHPKVSERELRDMADYWSRRDINLKGSPRAVLDKYIADRERDIATYVLKIRKILRQVAGAARNASVARNVKKGLRK